MIVPRRPAPYSDYVRSAYNTYRTYAPVVRYAGKTARQLYNATGKPKTAKSTKSLRGSRKVPLKTKVNKLVRDVKAKTSTSTFIYGTAGTLRSSVATTNQVGVDFWTAANCQTAMSQLRYFNPSAPATLITGDPSAGTYDSNYRFRSGEFRMSCRNSYNVPVKVTIYCCTPRYKTSSTPTSLYASGLTDKNVSTNQASPLLKLKDSDDVTKNWVVKSRTKLLKVGQTLTMVKRIKPFVFNPSDYDTDTTVYQKRWQAGQWVIHVQGVIGHDTAVSTEQTFTEAGIDYDATRRVVLEYDAGGVILNDIYLSDAYDTAFTNSGVVGQPAQDSYPYSTS